MNRYEYLLSILNKDPYQLERTDECDNCHSYTYICESCGKIQYTQPCDTSDISNYAYYFDLINKFKFDEKTRNTIKILFNIDISNHQDLVNKRSNIKSLMSKSTNIDPK